MRCWLNLDLPAEEIAGLRARFPDIEFLERHPAPANLANVEVAFVARQPIADETLATMTSLKWMHMQHGGADRFLTPTSREHPVRITSATGATGQPFVEFAIACIFTLAKRLPEVWRAQSELRWDESIVPASVEGSTLGVVGLGSIGSRVARKAHGLGMRVLATKRQVGPDVPEYVDELGSPSFLPGLLAQSDYVGSLFSSSHVQSSMVS